MLLYYSLNSCLTNSTMYMGLYPGIDNASKYIRPFVFRLLVEYTQVSKQIYRYQLIHHAIQNKYQLTHKYQLVRRKQNRYNNLVYISLYGKHKYKYQLIKQHTDIQGLYPGILQYKFNLLYLYINIIYRIEQDNKNGIRIK